MEKFITRRKLNKQLTKVYYFKMKVAINAIPIITAIHIQKESFCLSMFSFLE